MPPTIEALSTVIGAVGPDICVEVPPNKAAKKAMNAAPKSPADAPSPDCSPKAKANGRATTPAVSPPNKSPLKCLKSKCMCDWLIVSEQPNDFELSQNR